MDTVNIVVWAVAEASSSATLLEASLSVPQAGVPYLVIMAVGSSHNEYREHLLKTDAVDEAHYYNLGCCGC